MTRGKSLSISLYEREKLIQVKNQRPKGKMTDKNVKTHPHLNPLPSRERGIRN
jgi:hypothetical protein